MFLPRRGGPPIDHQFSDLVHLLEPGDLLVANDTRVMACRLRGRRASGGAVELLLLEPGPGPVAALARPAKKLAIGDVLTLGSSATARVLAKSADGHVTVELSDDPEQVMAEQGEMPLPPYLDRAAAPPDVERYQTVFAGPLGAAAAPTAGLHFDDRILDALDRRGVGWATVTLHVGVGTFRPLREHDLETGALHRERFDVPEATSDAVRQTRRAGGRVIAVGTTSARTLESATPPGSVAPVPGSSSTTLFVRPPYEFRALDGLITNFHLPRSSLLMLVGALVGRERLLAAYREAIDRSYRFYSYGDAMLLL